MMAIPFWPSCMELRHRATGAGQGLPFGDQWIADWLSQMFCPTNYELSKQSAHRRRFKTPKWPHLRTFWDPKNANSLCS